MARALFGNIGVNSMTTRKPVWFVRRASDNAILARNRKWYIKLASADDIKWYRRESNLCVAMHKYRIWSFTAFAIYSDDIVDCCGNIERGKNKDSIK